MMSVDSVAVPTPTDALEPAAAATAAPPSTSSWSGGFWGEQLRLVDATIPWLWEGYLAGGQTTLLTSQWKSGKTTLLSILLSRLKQGGRLGELPVSAARAIVVSEESRQQRRPRHEKLDLSHVYFFCRPFVGKPTLEQWIAFLDHLAELRRAHGFGLVAIDTLSSFLPGGNESNPDVVMKALLPLQRLLQLGMSVLLNHHPRKGLVLPGQASRGSGAFSGFADVIIEMYRCPGASEQDRRRRLCAYSRSPVTPLQLVLELNADGTDYATGLPLLTQHKQRVRRRRPIGGFLLDGAIDLSLLSPHRIANEYRYRAGPEGRR